MPMGNNTMELGRGQVVHSTKWKENETRTCVGCLSIRVLQYNLSLSFYASADDPLC